MNLREKFWSKVSHLHLWEVQPEPYVTLPINGKHWEWQRCYKCGEKRIVHVPTCPDIHFEKLGKL
jgi:hypothetical protein